MKKLFALLVALSLILTCFLTATAESSKISIVTTIFPIYDWVREIVGDNSNVEINLLLDSGVDLHSYQPTVQDIAKISAADVFIHVGGESDEWVNDVLAEASNKEMKVVNLVEAMGEDIKMEEIVEGMEHEHDHEHEHSEAHDKEVSTFDDNQVQDRSLNDWAGEWQSAYPYVLDGTLDKGFEHKAESGKMTAEEYKAYYAAGYASDIAGIRINGDTNVIEFTDVNGNTCKSEYKYLGYYIQDWSTGTRAAMYRFEALDKNAGAPVFIEFNDHIIEPVKAEHFHFRSSNESFEAIEDPENKWPTFYPASFGADEMLDAFIGHGHKEDDHDEKEHASEPFDDSEVEDRPLSDFVGDWKSAYPYLLNGSLDEAIEHSAEDGSMTVEEYHAYYEQGLKADAERLVIGEDGIFTFYVNGEPHQSEYEYKNYLIYWNVYGSKGVRYQYQAKNPENGVPKYVQISDHMIHPGKAEHLHVYVTDVSFEHLVEDTTNWPYYFPSSMTDDELIASFGGGHSHDHGHGEEADEHVWLSLRNAQKLIASIADKLCEADPTDAEFFRANASSYIAKLAVLDNQYQETVDSAARKTVLFGDRFPFRYLVDDYGLEYFAAFSGCSAESEASFETVAFLAGKMDELKLPAVLTIEKPHTRIAQTIIESTLEKNQKIFSLDSMQSTTADEIAAGTSYLKIMESNLAVLRDVLN